MTGVIYFLPGDYAFIIFIRVPASELQTLMDGGIE
jgi:hypothetical protein